MGHFLKGIERLTFGGLHSEADEAAKLSPTAKVVV